MKKSISTAASITNWVVLVALLVVIVLHLMPYWQYEAYDILTFETSDKTASIQDYIWRNFDHLDLEDEFSRILKAEGVITRTANIWDNNKYWINNYILSPILAFLPAVAGVILCVLLRKSLITAILPVVSGAAGVIAFTSNPIIMNKAVLAAHGGASFMNPSIGLIASVVTLALGIIFLGLCVTEFALKKAEKAKKQVI